MDVINAGNVDMDVTSAEIQDDIQQFNIITTSNNGSFATFAHANENRMQGYI